MNAQKSRYRSITFILPLWLFSSGLTLLANAVYAAGDIQTHFSSEDVSWILPSGYDNVEVSVGGSRIDGLTYSSYDENSEPRPDGYYAYHVSANPQEMVDDIAAMKAAREAGDGEAYSRLANKLQEGSAYETVTTSGAFEIKDGQIEEYDEEAKALAAQEARIAASMEKTEESE